MGLCFADLGLPVSDRALLPLNSACRGHHEKEFKECTKDTVGLFRWNTEELYHEACGQGL